MITSTILLGVALSAFFAGLIIALVACHVYHYSKYKD